MDARKSLICKKIFGSVPKFLFKKEESMREESNFRGLKNLKLINIKLFYASLTL